MEDSKSSRKLPVRPRKKKRLCFFNNITDELLIEIFIRLPCSKEATRCKLVCKRWLSLISSHYFVYTSSIHHGSNDDKILQPFTLVLHDQKNQVEYVECLRRRSPSSLVDFGFLPARPNQICLGASCGDLILCTVKQSYYICNIFTRQWIVLPPSPLGFGGGVIGVGFLIVPNCVDNARYEYLVLRFIPYLNSRLCIEMFSSEQDRWTKLIVKSPAKFYSSYKKKSLIACGRMLFTVRYKGRNMIDCVVAFDPFTDDPTQLLHVIDLPLEARDIPCLSFQLGVCQGRLRFAQVITGSSRYLSIWELEDYRKEKWTLICKRTSLTKALGVPIKDLDTINLVSVISFHPNNEDLICFRVGNYRIVVYNIRTNKVESSTYPCLFKVQDVGMLPITQKWWPTPLRQSL